MRVLVCGGRDFADLHSRKRTDPDWDQKEKEYKFVHSYLNKFCIEYSEEYVPNDNWLPTDITVIAGAAKGVDTAAIDFAIVNYCPFKEYPADWDKYGRSAGPIRNKQMLDFGKPDLVIAFPGGKGTEMMIKLAKDKGVPVIEVKYE